LPDRVSSPPRKVSIISPGHLTENSTGAFNVSLGGPIFLAKLCISLNQLPELPDQGFDSQSSDGRQPVCAGSWDMTGG
jgi:hypothetical protein